MASIYTEIAEHDQRSSAKQYSMAFVVKYSDVMPSGS